MSHKLMRLSGVVGTLVLCCCRLAADVTVTEPTGGNDVSTDYALNSTNGAGYAALGNIVITEGAANDISRGTNLTFILTLPGGWRFNTATGPSASFIGGRDITSASVAVTTTNVTVTFTVAGTNKLDQLTISGLQVQPLDGYADPSEGFILNLSANPGTAVIAGIGQDATTFGLLNTVAGTPRALQINLQPSLTATAGVAFAQQPDVMTYDQFGNQCFLDQTTVVTASRATGSGVLLGTTNLPVIAGDATFADLSENVANTISLIFSATNMASVISSNIVVGPAAASQLAFSVQPGAAMVGAPFGTQPVVNSQDPFGNNSAVGLPASQMVTMSLASGAGPIVGTTNRDIGSGAGNGTAAYSDLQINTSGNNYQLRASSPGLSNAMSSVFSVGGATFAKLLVLAPGETYAPGPGSGKAGTPNAQTAGISFNVTVMAVDTNNNVVSASDTVSISSSDTNAILAANAPLVNGSNSFSVTLKAAGNSTVTASDVTDNTRSPGTSSAIAVNAGPFAGLQLLLPGESAAPGNATGKTGYPSYQIAGNPFSVTVNGVDGCWNLIATAADTAAISSSDTNAVLPANGALVGGTKTFSVTLNTPGYSTLTASDLSDGTKAASTSPLVGVSSGAPARLAVQIQPSQTATAGVAFAQQPVVRVEDTNGNLFFVDSGRVITATRATGSGALQGTVTAVTTNGLATFANLSYNVAETITLSFTAAGLTNAVSSNVLVRAASAAKLAFTSQPGGVSRAGSPLGAQPVVKGQDQFGNNSSAGLPASLPVTLSLNSGSGSLLGVTNADIGTAAGNGTASFTNVQCTTGGTNKQFMASASGLSNAVSAVFAVGGVDPATGGILLSADTAGGAFMTLTGPVYYEVASADVGVGTIILNTPTGFSFDTTGTAPTVLIRRLTGSGANSSNIDGVASGTAVAIGARTTNQITLTITNASSGGVTCSLTWTNVRVRPNLGTPLASGNLTKSGTAAMAAVTASNTTFGALIEVPGVANRLAFSTQPGSATAGNLLGIQPVVVSRDQFGNNSTSGLPSSKIVTLTLSAGTGPLLGTAGLDLGTGAGNGAASWSDLQINAAGTNKQLTASAAGFTNGLSSVFTVSPATASRLTIQTQPSLIATAGVAFASQPVVRIEDSFGNLETGDSSTLVTASRALGSSALQGTTSRTAAGGLVTFTNLSYNLAETISVGFASGSLTGATSSNVVVKAAAASRLTILTQPSATGTAGVPFGQQPVLRIEDAFGNLRVGDNTTVVTATRSVGAGTLQGTTNVTAAGGLVSFGNLANNVATNIAILFSSGTLSSATSGTIAVSPAAFSKLLLLAPGETASPGSATGKTGTPTSQTVGTFFNVTVNGVDGNWNQIAGVTDTVGITSSDSTAALPANAAMVSGSQQFAVAFGTNGSFTVTANDLSDGSKTASTSSAIAVSAAQFTPATGGGAILADGATGTFTSLTGPTYSENASGNVGTGTIILNAPAGFVFDTGGTAPTVVVTRVAGAGGNANNINRVASGTALAMTSVSAAQLTFTVTGSSASGVTCKLTWQNIRVRPTAGTPLASGSIEPSGTASVVGMTTSADLGTLREVAGAANKLVIQAQPSASATAGVVFAQQPVLQVQDQFGNVRNAANGNADNSTVATAGRSAGSGTLQGSTSLTAVNGLVSYTNLSHNVATNITILFSSGSLASATSSAIAVSPGGASALMFTTQPGNATAGSIFGTQPVIRSQDAFGNNSASGLPASLTVSLTLSGGSGPLQGAVTSDIGTAAGNGVGAFTNLRIDSVGTNKQLTASATGLSSAISAVFAVNPGAATHLVMQTQPPATATAGVAFSPAPVVQLADAFGNVVTSDNSTVVAATRSTGTVSLQGTTNVTVAGGVATFANLSYNLAETMSIGFSSQGLSGTTSSNVTVNAGAASRLTIATQPSAMATAGIAFAQQPVVRVEDSFGNLRSSDNSTVVTATRGAGNGTLQGTTNQAAAGGLVTFTNLSHNVATNITIAFSSGALTGATSAGVAVSPGAIAKLQLLAPGESNAPGTVPGKIGTPLPQTAGTAFNVTANAVDAFWNVVNTNDTVGITSSDTNAALPGIAGLVNGSQTLSVTLKTAGSATVTASDLTNPSYPSYTTPAITVNGGAFTKLQILAPGETAAPGTATGKAGTPSSQTAGTAFNVTVNAVDANWNTVVTNDTVAISSSDVNAALPGNAALIGGTQTFSVTLKTASSATVTASDVTHPTIQQSTTPSIAVAAGAFAKLQILAPGENASPGSSTGKSGTPSAETAGSAFNVTVNAVDANWNVASSVSDVVTLSSSDANAALPANTALAAGTRTFSVTFKTVGSATVTASDFSDGTKSSNTSAGITVGSGAFVKLQLLTPGETAAPGTATGKTGTPIAQTAGNGYSVTVNAVDANWNAVTSVSDVVSITSTDPNAGLPANAALASGSKIFSLTNKTVGSWTVSAGDTTDGTKAGYTSPAIIVNSGAFAKLQLLAPGETAAPGSASGKTGMPTAQIAGTAFSVTVNAVDANWNLVNTNDTVAITSSDANAGLPGNTALSLGTKVLSLTLKTAGSSTVTASDVTHAGITASTSPAITVNPGVFTKLQLLAPGETASPGSATGKTGTPTARTAGTTFTVTVNAVDANWNLVSTNDTVAITSSDANAAMPANTALSAGTQAFSVTLKTAPSQTLTASDITSPTIQQSTSPSLTVNAATLAKLQLLAPGETAAPGTTTGKTGTPAAQTAGTAFNVTVNAVDLFWNAVSTNDMVAITSSDVNAALPASTVLSLGSKVLSLTLKTAGSATVTASDLTTPSVLSSTSPAIPVGPGAFAKLQLLVPGESALPGGSAGKSGTPSAETAGSAFNVTVNAVDANWNLVPSVTDVVTLSSSDANATLPGNTALAGGTQVLSVTFKTAGGRTITASDFSDGTKTNNASPTITVGAGAFVKLQLLTPGEAAAPGTANGKTGAPNTQTAGTGYSVTVNAVDANWNLVSSVADVVSVTTTDPNNVLPPNTALAGGTKALSLINQTVGSWTVTAVDTTDGTKTSYTSPAITVSAGALAKLQVLVPGESAAPGSASGKIGTPTAQTAGTAFSVTVNAVDANWNLVSTNDTVAITSSDMNAALPGNTALSLGSKVLSVTLKTAGSSTVTASDATDPAILQSTSASILVSAGAFTKLQILAPGETASPGSITGKTGTPTTLTAGVTFSVTVNAVDVNWNLVSTNDTIGITSSDANGVMPANAALSAGTQTFSVTLKTTPSQTLTASDITYPAIQQSTTPSLPVSAPGLARLQLLVPGETAAPGTATGKSGTPAAQTAGTPFTVTVNAVDMFWNVVSTNDAVAITSSDLNAALPANAALAGGTRIFSVTPKTAGTTTVSASDVTHASVTNNTSPAITVGPGAFAKLQMLVPGESAMPGSSTGKSGTPNAETAGSAFNVTVNAVDANWNLVPSVTDVVTLSSSDANATLPGNTALAGGTQVLSVTFKTAGSRTITTSDFSDGTKTNNASPTIAVGAGVFVKLQLLTPGETAAPGTVSGKTGTPIGQTAGIGYSVTVNAVDANWNLVSSVADVVSVATTDPNDVLPPNTALAGGTKTLSLTNQTVGSWTVTAADATDGTKTSYTSPAITVSAGALAKLQVLVPGETAAPGSATGKTGTPTAQTAGTAFSVTVNAVDSNWNLVNTNDTVAITSSDVNAGLPGNTALSLGSKVMSLTLKTAGSSTVTASDASHPAIQASTSASIPVSAGAFTKLQLLAPGETALPGSATGKTGTPTTRTAGTAFNVTVNAVDANWNVISTNDTVAITSSDANAAMPANAALSAGTQTFSVTLKTTPSQTLTASDQSNPSYPSYTTPGITISAAALAKLQILAPGETVAPGTATGKTGTPAAQTAGTPFTVTVNAVDMFWNLVSTNDTVAITSSDVNAALPANAALTGGSQTYSVTLKTGGSATVTASDATHASVTNNSSPVITVGPGAFAKLQLLVPGESALPGSSAGKSGTPNAETAGSAFNVTVNAVDANWNLVPSVSDVVTLGSSDANAMLPGNTALAGGTQVLSVTFKTAGGRTITASDFSDGTKTNNASPTITVGAGAFAKLQLLVPGEAVAPGTVSGKSGAPIAETTGTGYSVTVNAVDANWNLVASAADVIAVTSSDPNAGLPPNAALASGTKSFGLTNKTVGSWTVTATDATDGTKTAYTTPAVTINAGAFAKLRLLTPGESAAPGTATGKTGTPLSQTAGTAFAVTVNAVDANWNLVATNDTVGITSSDANAALPANAALAGGTQSFSVTLKTGGSATLTASDFTHGTIPGSTSPAIPVGSGSFVKLQLLAPGETAAPGTSLGKTGTPTARTAGIAFNVTVNAVDGNWNVVNTNDTIGITSSDANAALPSNGVLSLGSQVLSLTLKTAGSATVTVSDVTTPSIQSSTSPSLTVNAGAAARLQILLPGETTAPGTVGGKTGTPTTQTAGVAIVKGIKVNAVDANWNFIATASSNVVISSSDANAAISNDNGTNAGNMTLVAGTATLSNFTFKAAAPQTITASDPGGVLGSNISTVTVNPGAFAKLQLLTPGETASPGSSTGKTGTPLAQTAGTALSVTVNAVDANWNTVASAADVVTVTSSDSNAVLPANTALSAGTATLSLTFRTAGTRTITAFDISDGTKTNNTSPAITVNVGAFMKLQLLAPGESAVPGSATGKTGIPNTQTAGTAFNVTVNAVDSSWNLVNTASDTVGITSSDANSIPPANAALAFGAKTFSVTFKTTGSQTVTATDISDGSKTGYTSPAIPVTGGVPSKLVIQTQPSSAATAGVAFVQQPAIVVQDAGGNYLTTNGLVVTAARGAGSGTLQGVLTATTVGGVATFTNLSHNVATNITIIFTSGTLASATSSVVSVSAAPASRLTVLTQPGASAMAGVAFAPQPAVRIEDAFGNLMAGDNSTVVTAARSTGSGTLQGTTSLTATGGVVAFTNLSYNVAETMTIGFAAGTLSSATSSNVVVGAGPASQLAIQTQPPANATAGAAFVPQPVIWVKDQFGNLRSGDNSTLVTATRSAGSGTLQGATNVTAIGGVATFANLSHNVATNITIAFTSGGLTGATSGTIAVGPAAASRLTILTQPSASATAGVAFAQQPAIRIEDQFGNLRSSDSSTMISAARAAGSGSLQGALNAIAFNGVASFANLSHNVATNITIAFTSGGLTGTTSSVVTVSAAAASRLTVLTQPSSAATAGVAFAQQPAIRIEDAFGNLENGDNSTVVTALVGTHSTGSQAGLQGTTIATASGGVASFGNLSYNVAETISLVFTNPVLAGTLSSNVVVSPAAASRLTILTQPSTVNTAGVAFVQQPVIRIEDQFGNLRSSDNATVVTATRNAGSGLLQGSTNVAAIGGVVAFTNLSHTVATNITITFSSGSLTATTSTAMVVSPAAASGLVFTTQPANSTAGSAFGTQPVVKSQDAFGNFSAAGLPASLSLSMSLTSGAGPLQGTTTLDIGAGSGNGTATFTNLRIDAAGTNKQLTASASGLSSALSSVFTVSPAVADHLVIQTQPSASVTAGTVFAQQPVILIADAFGNPRSDNGTVVSAARSLGSAALQGTTSLASIGGAVTFTNLSYNVAETISISFSSGGLTGSTSSNVVAGAAAASRLTIQTQPAAAATAGVAFAPQPVIRIEDQFGNLRSGDNTTVVTATRSAGSGTLQGATNVTAAGGLVSFSNLAHNVATNITLAFSSPGLNGTTSGMVAVSPAAASQLAIQTQPPANATAGTAFTPQPVVWIEDAFGNLRNGDSGTVVTVTRSAGSGTLQGTTNVASTGGVVSFANLSHNVATNITLAFSSPGLSGATSTTIAVGPAAASQLVIQTQPPANATAGAAFTLQPVLWIEDVFGNLRSGDSSTVVTATRSAGSGILQGATNVTATAGVVTFTNLSHNVATNITIAFTSGGLTGATSGTITIGPAAANRLTIATQPSASATAGVAFAQQPFVRIEDQFGNLRSADSGTVVSAARAGGSGTLQGSLSATALNGLAAFTNLSHNVATNITISFSSAGLTGATSSTVNIGPAAAIRLTVLTQPSAAATAGVAFAPQPAIRIEDAFGNLESSDNSTVVAALVGTHSTGSQSGLQGTTTATASGGVASFGNLSYNVAETISLAFTNPILAGTISSNVVVSAAAASRLTILMQPSTTGTAGVAFAQQPVVRIEDPFGNLRSSDNVTVVTATRNAGSGLLQGSTNVAASGGVVAFTNLAHIVATNITITFSSGSLTATTTTAIAISPAAASALVFTTQPANATAGSVFATQPVVRSQDAFGNFSTASLPASLPLTMALTSGTGPLQGTTTLDIGTASGNGKAAFTNLRIDAASNNDQLTASAAGLSSTLSSVFTVSPSAFVKLQLLTPGEVAAPGSASGKTGTPAAQTAGGAFNVTVNAVDAQWNLVTNAAHTVGITSSDNQAILPANTVLSLGTKVLSVTLKTAGSSTLTASDITDASKTANSSPPIPVGVGVATNLAIQAQPPTTATAGVVFAPAAVVRVQDASGNLVSTDSGRVITATRGAGTGTLQGTLTATTVGGVATFTNLSYNVAETITINFAASGLTSATSSNVVVNAAMASRLAFTTQPGGVSRTGSPLATQPVVKSQDVFGNTSTVGLPGSLNVSLALITGSGSLVGTTTLDIGTNAGGGTVAFTNVQCSDAGTNKQITASTPALTGVSNAVSAVFLVGGVDRALGGTAIPSSSAGVSFTPLTGPTYYEAASGDVGGGTIVLNAPSGFVFDTGGTAPTVLITRIGGSGTDINGVASGTSASLSRVTTTALTFKITSTDSGVTDSLTWQNVRVQPTASSPLASGNITNTGTAVVAAGTGSASYGQLIEVGPAARLTIQTQPSTSATAGVPFAVQPVIRLEDALGNLVASDNSTVVTAARSAGSGTLQGTLTATAVGGLATFTNLSHNVATNITILFSSGSLTNTISTTVSVSAAAANRLTIATQPSATATAGSAFAQQPVIRVEDQFGNLRSADNSTVVSAARAAGGGTLQGSTNVTANGGLASFSNLSHTLATNITIAFSSGGLAGATSTSVSIGPASASRLTVLTQPSVSATAGVVFAQQPSVRVEDVFGNLESGDNSTLVGVLVATHSSLSQATLQGTTVATASGGVASFGNLSYSVAETITLRFTNSALASATSGNVTVNPTTASRLTILTQPSTSNVAGVAFVQQPVLRIEDAFGNLRSGDNSTVVTATRNTGSGVLQGSTNVTASSGVVAFTNLSHTVATNITITFSSVSLTSTTSTTVAISPAAAARLAFAVQPGNGTVGGLLATQPVVRSQDPFGNNSTLGMGGSDMVTMTLGSGAGPLVGSASLDIGTNAGNGVVTFTNLEVDAAGTNKQLMASASGMSNALSAVFSVEKGNQTITFGALPDETYGDPPSLLSATASSGLPVSFSVISGQATISNNMLRVTCAGMVTVQASQPGNTNWNAATPVSQSFLVSKAPLLVEADDKTRVYGASNPPLTVSYMGFVNGDTAAVLNGAPALSTTATSSSPVSGSPYTISVTSGTLSSTNYVFLFMAGQLTITPAGSAGTLSSSANPCLTGSNLTLTATLSAVLPSTGVPGGSVQFRVDGSPLGAPRSLTNGAASLTTASLTHGLHTVTVEYAGDGNFLGATNGLGASQVINTPPLASLATYGRPTNTSLQISVSGLLATNTSDADGDVLTLVSIGAGTNGATITLAGSFITYQPSTTSANRNTTDHFNYVVSDGFLSGTATNQIAVVVSGADPASQRPLVTGLTVGTNGANVSFHGAANVSYHVERAVALAGGVWTDLGTATTDPSGNGQFTDMQASTGQGFYRVVWKPQTP